MTTIWKFGLLTVNEQAIDMPAGAEVLCVQTQDDSPQLWALVDPKAPRIPRKFRIFGTGDPSVSGTYVGTYQLLGGKLVFHVFEGPWA